MWFIVVTGMFVLVTGVIIIPVIMSEKNYPFRYLLLFLGTLFYGKFILH